MAREIPTVAEVKDWVEDWSLEDVEAALARAKKAKTRDAIYKEVEALIDALHDLHENVREVADRLIDMGAK